uniref:Uncharacterized protein n=1 Tax=Arundo donax TaxID=35708 RepID=A0A0A8Z8X9_ARUDO
MAEKASSSPGADGEARVHSRKHQVDDQSDYLCFSGGTAIFVLGIYQALQHVLFDTVGSLRDLTISVNISESLSRRRFVGIGAYGNKTLVRLKPLSSSS